VPARSKKIKGRKRHLLVDTLGLMLHAVVHSAGLQDRDGGVLVMATLFGMFPFLRKLYADAGYQGPKLQAALRRVLRQLRIQIVRRPDTAQGFEVLPRRWVVERTIAWLTRGEGQVEHGPVPRSPGGAGVGRVEQRLHLLPRQMPHQRLVGSLGRAGAAVARRRSVRRLALRLPRPQARATPPMTPSDQAGRAQQAAGISRSRRK
jgi:transposase